MTDLVDERAQPQLHQSRSSPAAGVARPAANSWTWPEFWMTYWLAFLFACAKVLEFDLPLNTHLARWSDLAHGLPIATAADNLFALCFGIVAAISMFAFRRWPRLRRGLYWLWATFAAVCVMYAFVNAYVYHYVHMPLTRELLHAAGCWADLKSSLRQCVDARGIASIIGGPVAFLLVTHFCNHLIGVPRSRAVKAVIGLMAVGVCVQFGYAFSTRRIWEQRPDHRVSVNPHWAIVTTYLMGSGDVKVHFPKQIPADYDVEFQPMRERGFRSGVRGSYSLPFSTHPRHVIIYVMESVGTQFLHLYGSQFLTTPKLDAEAAHSLVFDNFYAHAGQTRRAMVSINSSNQARPEWQPQLYDPAHPLNQPGAELSQTLKSHGFRTLAITSSNFHDFDQTDFLKAAEFDTIWDRSDLNGEPITSWGKEDSVMVDKLMEWIDSDPAHATPFFALCWTNQTHHPYGLSRDLKEVDMVGDAKPPFPADVTSINRELNCLLDADRQIERMLDGLRARGLADDTLVVITGDHGEGFNWPHDSLGHGFRVYQENLHIPCILWNPRLFNPGRRSDLVSGQIDLAPTIVDALGFEPAGTWQGHSLFDPEHPRRVYFYGALDEILVGVREGDWKYTCNSYTGFEELYNLHTDPTEQRNLASGNAIICHNLSLRAGAWLTHLDQYGAAVRP